MTLAQFNPPLPDNCFIIMKNNSASCLVYNTGHVYLISSFAKNYYQLWKPTYSLEKRNQLMKLISSLDRTKKFYSLMFLGDEFLMEYFENYDTLLYFVKTKETTTLPGTPSLDESCDRCFEHPRLRWIDLQLKCPNCWKVFAG